MSAAVEARHGDGCECVRCVGFQAGHTLSTRHGAYATPVRLFADDTVDLADELRPLVPGYRPGDEVTLQLLALAIRRLRRAEVALDAAAPEDLTRLAQDCRGWANTAGKLADRLALNNTQRGRLGLDVARTQREVTLTAVVQEAELERRQPAPIEAGDGDVVEGLS